MSSHPKYKETMNIMYIGCGGKLVGKNLGVQSMLLKFFSNCHGSFLINIENLCSFSWLLSLL